MFYRVYCVYSFLLPISIKRNVRRIMETESRLCSMRVCTP